jgi:hypothetical protein
MADLELCKRIHPWVPDVLPIMYAADINYSEPRYNWRM